MLHTNFKKKDLVRDEFASLLSVANDVYIAAGYFGKSEVDRHTATLIEKVKQGGSVQLILGLANAEGISQTLNDTLVQLHQSLRKYSANSGVFVSESRYHGKLYIAKGSAQNSVLIGSSNFSFAGFEGNIELNINSKESTIAGQAFVFFINILRQSHAIDMCHVPIKSPRASLVGIQNTPRAVVKKPNRSPDFEIPIRIQPHSSINLFLSRGRVNSKTGFYTPRPFFEVELTLPQELWVAPLTKFVPNVTGPVSYIANCDTGETFEVKFKRKSNSKLDQRGLHSTGGDFMSSPREQLGRYIKGKLIRSGFLSYGEPVTSDTLTDYGNDHLNIWIIDSNTMFIDF